MSEITLNSLPKTLDELKAMPQAALTVPEEFHRVLTPGGRSDSGGAGAVPGKPCRDRENAGFPARPAPLERHRQTVYPRPFSRQGIPDAFLPCRFHTGKQLHTCAAVPSHRFGKHLQPDAVCRRVPDLICGLQRR